MSRRRNAKDAKKEAIEKRGPLKVMHTEAEFEKFLKEQAKK